MSERSSNVLIWLLLTGTLLALAVMLSGLAARAGAPMLWFMVAVSIGGGLIELGLAGLRGQFALSRRVLVYTLGAGALQALPTAMGYLAVIHVGSGFLSLTYAFPIILTWIIARIIGLERHDTLRLLAVLLGLSGGLILAYGKLRGALPGTTFWAVVALAAPVIVAAGNIYRSRFWPEGAPPVLLAGLTLVLAGLVTIPFAALLQPPPVVLWADPHLRLLTGLGILAFAAQFITYFQLQRAGGPVMLSLIGPVAAVVGAAIAALALGEVMPGGILPAAVLTGTGVALMVARAKAGRPGQGARPPLSAARR